VRDLAQQTTTLASTDAGGAASTGASGPSISADGSRVSFASSASNLTGAISGFRGVFVRDLTQGTTSLGSARDGTATAGRFGAASGSLSGNGACVAFGSTSDDLVAGGFGSDYQHVFLHALNAACPVVPAPIVIVPPPLTAPPPPPLRDTTAPVISKLELAHKSFALGAKATATSAATKKKHKTASGTTFTFTLSENATTRIAIVRRVKGHRASTKRPCAAAKRGQKLNCTRTVTELTLVRAHTAKGANRVAFSGRYGKRKHLVNGSYTATLTATDPTGNRSKPHSVTFSVVNR
jgi:hypothetical protein